MVARRPGAAYSAMGQFELPERVAIPGKIRKLAG